MTTHEEEMTSEQRLQLIHTMINKARFNFSRGSFYFILWGVLLVGGGVFEYVMDRIVHSDWAFAAWPVIGVVGGIASAIYGSRSTRKGAFTHLDRVYSGIWLTYFATLILFITGAVTQQVNPGSYIMLLTGFPTFLTGYVLKFRPLIIGGIGFWVLGFLSLYTFEDYRSLIFALSIVQGYLVPGFLMRNMKEEDV